MCSPKWQWNSQVPGGYGDRAWNTLVYIKTSPVLDPMRDHPKFISLLRLMQLE